MSNCDDWVAVMATVGLEGMNDGVAIGVRVDVGVTVGWKPCAIVTSAG